MSRKIYHVTASRTGAFGAGPALTVLPGSYTNRREADAERRRLAALPGDGRTVYFVEWEWKA